MRNSPSALLASVLVAACGIDPDKVPDHILFADDGARIEREGPVGFAVLGNSREGVLGVDRAAGRRGHGVAVTESVVADVVANEGGLDFVALLGDTVRASSTVEWKVFDKQWASLLLGQTSAPGGAGERLTGVPVAGDREAAGDKRFRGWGGAWPAVGSHIGYNRVGSWYAFDVESQGSTWRFLVLDSGKARLGSRWREQMNWIPRTLEQGRFDNLVVLMHDGLFDLASQALEMNPDGAPGELLDHVEDSMGLMKLRAVFFAGHHANQVFMPFGPYGTVYVGAGGGGAPADDLRRWGPADAAGVKGDVQLEAMYDLSLMNALDAWNRDHPLPEGAIDQAKAKGSYQGYTGTYDAAHFPTYGWWKVTLNGPTMQLAFRHRLPDGTFHERYKLWFDPGNGWKAR